MAKAETQSDLPDWKRPFENDDFRGFFTWGSDLTARLGSPLYHACHLDEARAAIKERRIGLRSDYSITHPSYGVHSAPCVWCGLNYYHNGNKYGPILFSIPLKRLEGRTFMVFRRTGERRRYFFVQYEARIPIFVCDGKTDRRVDPAHYFDSNQDQLWLKPGAIYDVVLTQTLPLTGIRIDPTNHPYCIPKKCAGKSTEKSRLIVEKLAREVLDAHLRGDPAFRRLLKRFPTLKGAQIELPG